MIAVGQPRTLTGGRGLHQVHSFDSLGVPGAAQPALSSSGEHVHTSLPRAPVCGISLIFTRALLCSQEMTLRRDVAEALPACLGELIKSAVPSRS